MAAAVGIEEQPRDRVEWGSVPWNEANFCEGRTQPTSRLLRHRLSIV